MERVAESRATVPGCYHRRGRRGGDQLVSTNLSTPHVVRSATRRRVRHRGVEGEPADRADERIDAVGVVCTEDDGIAAAGTGPCGHPFHDRCGHTEHL